jgi:hypothetical protein
MNDIISVGDAVASTMLATLDSYIGEFESRGWLREAASAEELVCAIYDRLGIAMPAERISRIEALLDQDLTRTQST